MGRGKVQLKFIEKQSLRKSMYIKRFGGVKKKAYELSKLCDVPVMVISVDYDGKVDTYPENKEEFGAILKRYNLTSNKVLEKNRQNPEKVIQSQILKKQLGIDQIKKDTENMLSAAVYSLDSKLIEIQNRMSYLKMLSDTNELQIDTQMPAEESAKHDNVLNLFEAEAFSFEDLLKRNNSEWDDLLGLLQVEEFRVDGVLKEDNAKSPSEKFPVESHFPVEHMDDMEIDTHMATEESAYFHEHDDIPHLLEAMEFSIEDLLKGYNSEWDDL